MESHPKRPRLRQSIEESKLEAILNSAVAAIITIDTSGDSDGQSCDGAPVRLQGRGAAWPERASSDAVSIP